MKKSYIRLFTVEEIKEEFGYDLPSIAAQGGFLTKESACNAWCDEACVSIHNLISKVRGNAYAKKLYLENETSDIYQTLKAAQMYQMQFIIENGRKEAIAINSDNKQYSEDALNVLFAEGILVYGV